MLSHIGHFHFGLLSAAIHPPASCCVTNLTSNPAHARATFFGQVRRAHEDPGNMKGKVIVGCVRFSDRLSQASPTILLSSTNHRVAFCAGFAPRNRSANLSASTALHSSVRHQHSGLLY
ncbi:hypothetical protein R3P38DRAFT_1632300 [Favolaschia claudopus]|uniref:Secreted protein n=1 Tax=Favolaschia claudopus TaxID=2862362 RepID=A0AAW0DMK6_9AGAR